MSRKSVRSAVAASLQPPAVAGLNEVFRAKPRRVDADDYRLNMPDGTASGAVAYPFVESDREHRIAFTGTSQVPAGKEIVYVVGIVLRFHSNQEHSEDAQDDYDDMVEALKIRLRSDRQLGTAGSANVIFQAGEGDTHFGQDIEHHADIPRPLLKGNGTLVIWGLVRLVVIEIV